MTKEQYLRNLEAPKNKVDAVLDTDAYNEIDDQFAIAYLLQNADRISIRAFYAAPFLNSKVASPADGMKKSFDEILHILHLAGRAELSTLTFQGSTSYLSDEKTPVLSPAVYHLTELARQYTSDKPLYIVAIGAITNVASALLYAPDIRDKIVVVWLGGNAHRCVHNREFNLMQDVAAARVLFSSGAPIVQIPCIDVVEAFRVSGPELQQWLLQKNALSTYLAENTIKEAESYAKGAAWTRTIWDVTAVAWLINDNTRFMDAYLTPAPIPEYDDRYAFDPTRPLIQYVYHIRRDELMTDLLSKLARAKE